MFDRYDLNVFETANYLKVVWHKIATVTFFQAVNSSCASLHQSIYCSFHKKAERCHRQFLVDTGAADKPDRLPCAGATTCDGHDAKRVRAATRKYRSGPRQFALLVPAKLPLKACRHNRRPDCRRAMNMADSVSDSLPGSQPRRKRCSRSHARD